MDSYGVAEILKGLVEISAELDVEDVQVDDNESLLSIVVRDKGKRKRFLVAVKEI
jgi:hypothetical protein